MAERFVEVDHQVSGGFIRDTPETPELLVARFSGFRSAARAEAVNTLVSRPAYAQALLEAIQGGRIPRDAVSAFQIRQMQSFENAAIGRQVSDIWSWRSDLGAGGVEE